MIIFHEGMPRSGKSYEAMVLQIIPALQKGRPVDAYIEGLNFEKIAEVAEMPVERVRELLQQIEEGQVKEFHRFTRDNALVVLDEAQDFWPTGRQRLDEATTKAITQHGHRGQDILLMGQVFTDVHKLWRGRVSQKNFYLKLDAVGAENRYSCLVEKARKPERFERVTFNPKGVYDPKYFGTYASHVDSSIQTENFKDARADIRNTFFVRWTLPIVGGLAIWGLWFIWGYFHPDTPAKPVPAAGAASSPVVAPASVAQPASPAAKPSKPIIEQWNERYRPRLAYLYQQGGVYLGAVEWWDGDTLRDRLTFVELAIMGTPVDIRGSVVKVGGTWVTPWPIVRREPNGAGAIAPTMTALGIGS